MTPAQKARRQRLRAATCSIHGFGRNQLGQLMFGRHVEEIARTVEEALERKEGGTSRGSPLVAARAKANGRA